MLCVKRRVFNVLAGVSLLLCVLAIGLWIRSVRRWDAFVFSVGSTHSISVRSASAGTEVRLRSGGEPDDFSTVIGWKPQSPRPPEDPAAGYSDVIANYPVNADFTGDALWKDTFRAGRLGLQCRRAVYLHSESSDYPAGRFTAITVSDGWAVAAMAMASAIFWQRARRIRRRIRDGRCVACGYDLRATPERCPECGSRAGKAGTPT
jgi:hypothetical protein